jgi:hypothetical protein
MISSRLISHQLSHRNTFASYIVIYSCLTILNYPSVQLGGLEFDHSILCKLPDPYKLQVGLSAAKTTVGILYFVIKGSGNC